MTHSLGLACRRRWNSRWRATGRLTRSSCPDFAMKLRRSRKSLMRFGSELARGSGTWGGPGAWASLEGRGCQPGPLLSRPVALCHSGPQRLDMLLPGLFPHLGLSLRGCWWGRWQASPPGTGSYWSLMQADTCASRWGYYESKKQNKKNTPKTLNWSQELT